MFFETEQHCTEVQDSLQRSIKIPIRRWLFLSHHSFMVFTKLLQDLNNHWLVSIPLAYLLDICLVQNYACLSFKVSRGKKRLLKFIGISRLQTRLLCTAVMLMLKKIVAQSFRFFQTLLTHNENNNVFITLLNGLGIINKIIRCTNTC